MPPFPAVLTCAVLFSSAGLVAAQQPNHVSRGRLLYETHCIACHSEKMHWRDNKLVTDWSSLQSQVRRFQAVANLGWTDDDIDAVARFLDETQYHLPRAVARVEAGARR